MITQIVLIGGGSSIKELTQLGVWDKLQSMCTMGINFSFKDHLPTALCAADFKFYTGCVDCIQKTNKEGISYLDIKSYNHTFRKELENLPLIICPARDDMLNMTTELKKPARMDNTIFLPYTTAHKYYGGESKPEEIYHIIDESGMFGLGVACEIPTVKEIFLLGFDFCVVNEHSHYYEHTKHRGQLPEVYVWYKRQTKSVGADYYYKPFINNYPNVNIWNVSSISNITCFPKLTPKQFFDMIKGQTKSQSTLRNYIKSIFK